MVTCSNFDDIGNRISASKTGLPAIVGQLNTAYTVNNLNQYSAVDSDVQDSYVTGTADSDATVKVIRQGDYSENRSAAVSRNGEDFYAKISGTDGEQVTLDVYAVKGSDPATKTYKKASKTLTVQNAGTINSVLTYDDDGNMLTDGTWTYTWNGENRMLSAEKSDARLEFAYDYKGRRIEKKVYTGTPGNWTLASHDKYVYDNYVQVAEYNAMTTDTLAKSYLRDLDEMLLSMNDTSNSYYYNIDGNKNVRSMTDAAGTVVAEYEYSPFGQLLSQTGTMALVNPFKFSSEFYDSQTKLVYYNFRYYSPTLP